MEKIHLFPKDPAFPFSLLCCGVASGWKGDHFERSHPPFTIVELVKSGGGRVTLGPESFAPRTGDVYILPAHRHHRYHSDGDHPWKKVFFIFEGKLAEALLAAHEPECRYFPGQSSQMDIFRGMLALGGESPRHVHRKACLLFQNLLVRLGERPAIDGKAETRISTRVKEALDQSIESPIQITELGDRLGISRSYLIREFRAAYRKTPYEYLLSQRIQIACTYLTTTRLSIREISSRLSFGDEYHFAKTFKSRMGITPFRFRKSGGREGSTGPHA